MVVTVPHAGSALPIPTPLQAKPSLRKAAAEGEALASSRVAASLSRHLGLGGYLAGLVARAVLDLDRLAGVGSQRALGSELSADLDGKGRRAWLQQVYRRGLASMAEHWKRKRLSILVLDEDLRQPRVRWVSHRGFFDPLVSDLLLSRLCDPVLIDEIGREAGESALNESPMDAGRIAPRAQSFEWLSFLRAKVEPPAGPAPTAAHRLLWSSLLDSSQLSAESLLVSEYLHHGRSAPVGQQDLFLQMEQEYQQLSYQMERQGSTWMAEFLRRDEHLELLTIEVPRGLTAEDADRWGLSLSHSIERWNAASEV